MRFSMVRQRGSSAHHPIERLHDILSVLKATAIYASALFNGLFANEERGFKEEHVFLLRGFRYRVGFDLELLYGGDVFLSATHALAGGSAYDKRIPVAMEGNTKTTDRGAR